MKWPAKSERTPVRPDPSVDQALTSKGLKDFLKALAAVIILEGIIGHVDGPFIYLLFYQLAFLFILKPA